MPVREYRVKACAPRRHCKRCLCCVAGARGAPECGRKGLRPSSRGGHSRRAAAEYQPGYDGLPGYAQGLRALRIDYDQDHDDDQDFVGFDEARDKVRDET